MSARVIRCLIDIIYSDKRIIAMSNGNTFSRLFGQSPFTALQAHMRVVLECAREVQPLIEALSVGDTDKIIEKAGLLKKLLDGMEGGNVEATVTFNDVPPNSELTTVDAAAKLGKDKSCNMIIALGGAITGLITAPGLARPQGNREEGVAESTIGS